MDRHNMAGITAEDVARAHVADLEVQDEFCCTGMTYWLDEERGNVFCLIKAPDEQAVREMHAKAHGLVPHEIMEVDSKVVEAFLGRIHDPVPSPSGSTNELSIFSDPAFRAIMMVSIVNGQLLKSVYGVQVKNTIERVLSRIVLDAIGHFKGRMVEQFEGLMASFASVTNAVECAIHITENIRQQFEKAEVPAVDVAAGLSAGLPVDENDSLFGDAVEAVKIMCSVPVPGVIRSTAVVQDLYRGEHAEVFGRSGKIHVHGPEEELFLKRLVCALSELLKSRDFSVVELSNRLGFSQSNLYRRTKEITGKTPSELIMETRLSKSLEMMKKQHRNITEVSYGLEFSNPSYFSKCFRKKFKILPTQFLSNL